MSYRPVISIAVAAILGIGCISTDALAYRGGGRMGGVRAGGVHVGGVYRGGAYRGAYVRRGVGVGIGAAAVGAAVIAPRYYNRALCGYYPNPPCY
jgi:hypothetical protein